MSLNSFNSRSTLKVGDKEYEIYRLEALDQQGISTKHLPYSLRILLENLLRTEDGRNVTKSEVHALAAWNKNSRPDKESYSFLPWGQTVFRNLAIVPPDTGIVHQVNLEYLARVVFVHESSGKRTAYPDTLVGTDSHTTMINGLGVLGWGVGGIEAEAAMLGQPVSMLIPLVVGVKLTGRLREGATATDLVLTITEMLRKHGVVGKFVEYFGPGLQDLPLADRATIANMAPEYGATCGIFPIDKEIIRYLKLTGRSEEQIALVEAYAREQGLFHDASTPEAEYSELLSLDLATVESSLAGPKRPQDRVVLSKAGESFAKALPSLIKPKAKAAVAVPAEASFKVNRWEQEGGKPDAVGVGDPNVHEHIPGNGHAALEHGSVVIAAITSCTSTSNPSVMLAAGLLAKKAVERGLKVGPAVKASLAPGSRVVTDYLTRTRLQSFLDTLGFQTVGYGCTTCIGNSGPLAAPIEEAIVKNDLVAASVLSGNRNFEARVHPSIKANFLMSPPLVVAFALAGRVDIDLTRDPLGRGSDGKDVFLSDIWPTLAEVRNLMQSALRPEVFRRLYSDFASQNPKWNEIPSSTGDTYAFDATSTYIQEPPFFEDFSAGPGPIAELKGARALGIFGDSVTTDHISPAGSIKKASPAGRFLLENGVAFEDFNSYGSRRGNDRVMTRGTFANVRIKNLMLAGEEGGDTLLQPEGTRLSIHEAAVEYRRRGTPLVVLAGQDYGAGSSRDWAAKGTRLLGVKAVVAQSYERIHRSNLVGMGVLPLQFMDGTTAQSLKLDGTETYAIVGLDAHIKPQQDLT